MKVHLTCSHPSRNLVAAISVAREVLRAQGHAVAVSWPTLRTNGDGTALASFEGALRSADVIVHACRVGDALPAQLAEAHAAGRPIVSYRPGCGDVEEPTDRAELAVGRLEELAEAIALAASESITAPAAAAVA